MEEKLFEEIQRIPYKKNDPSGLCTLDIHKPTGSTNNTTLIWFHGGGLTEGSAELPTELKGKGILIFGINYRLAPQYKFPSHIQDAAAAIAWVLKNASSYGGNPDRIFLSGHSAGAYISLMCFLDKRWLTEEGEDPDRIRAMIALSAQTITHFIRRGEMGIPAEQPLVDSFAPLYHIRKDAPPLVLVTGDREIEYLGRYEENAYLARMMGCIGHKKTELHEIKGKDHCAMIQEGMDILLTTIQRLEN